MIKFIIGLIIGAVCGMFISSLCIIAKDNEDDIKKK